MLRCADCDNEAVSEDFQLCEDCAMAAFGKVLGNFAAPAIEDQIRNHLVFGSPLIVEDIDLTGWPAYVVSMDGKKSYYKLEKELVEGKFTGYYLKQPITEKEYVA